MKVRLEVKKGADKGKVFEFTGHDIFLFGRSELAKCHLANDNFVSRFHFLMEINPPKVWLKDLGSKNGTFVNGVKYGGRIVPDPHDLGMKKLSRSDAVNNLNSILFETELFNDDEICVGDNSIYVTVRNNRKPYERSLKSESDSYGLDIESLLNIVSTGKPDVISAIPDYEIVRKIGEGGMGTVYLARGLVSSGNVAIKIIKPEQELNQKIVKRFREREMVIVKSLEHKNITHCFDVDFRNGLYYIVMEYINGNDIQQIITRKGPFGVQEACRIIVETLEGLSYLHTHNIIHRDIKPSNIIISKDNKVKITDFGLAKDITNTNSLTKSSEYAGTYPFMPPEQLYNFKHCNFSTDVFSVGATLYYMCTKKYPHDYPKGKDVMLVNIQDPVIPVENRGVKIKQEIADVINKAVSLKMNERYQTAKEMQQALIEAVSII